MQISQIDIFNMASSPKMTEKFSRNWAIFNKREFEDEIGNLHWNDVTSLNIGTNKSVTNFFHKIDRLLDEMAPIKKLTKKEQGLKLSPWITYGIITSMRTRDSLYKKFANESNPTLKKDYFNSYKIHRNKVKSLIRTSKKDYFAKYLRKITQMSKKRGKELGI